jgi:hypothetical protein
MHHRHTSARLLACLLLAAGLSGAAQAALVDRGGGLIYDTDLNVTWLQDANYAKTSGYDADGRMTWANANTWAANLSYFDAVRNVTYSDWRLPTMVDTGTSGCNYANSGTDCGYNVQTVSGSTVYSEMAHMYFNNLGLKAYYSPTGTYQPTFGIFGNGTFNGTNQNSYGQNDVGLIDNLQSYVYWSGLEYAPNANGAWYFGTGNGNQTADTKNAELYAWAVRPGDVAAVPEAETYALMLAGLGLIGWRARRRG